jgi:hypothetical protein
MKIKLRIEEEGGEYSESGMRFKRRRLDDSFTTLSSTTPSTTTLVLNGTLAREMLIEEGLWRIVLSFL